MDGRCKRCELVLHSWEPLAEVVSQEWEGAAVIHQACYQEETDDVA